MAQPWCTGAAHFYVGVGANNAPLYLGTVEAKPMIQGQPKFEAILNDLSGAMPFDFSFLGQVEVISGIFTRYSESVWQAAIRHGTVLGTIGATDIGTIMGLEGAARPLWIQYPYAAKTAMATSEPGRHYFQTILFDPHSIEAGTRAKKVGLTWLAWGKYNPTDGKFPLFDTSMTGLPARD